MLQFEFDDDETFVTYDIMMLKYDIILFFCISSPTDALILSLSACSVFIKYVCLRFCFYLSLFLSHFVSLSHTLTLSLSLSHTHSLFLFPSLSHTLTLSLSHSVSLSFLYFCLDLLSLSSSPSFFSSPLLNFFLSISLFSLPFSYFFSFFLLLLVGCPRGFHWSCHHS